MAELREGQQIIFKHPGTGALRQGVVKKHLVVFLYTDLGRPEILNIQKESVTEWCDASEAWNALTQHKPKAGNFEWSHPENEGPAVGPIK